MRDFVVFNIPDLHLFPTSFLYMETRISALFRSKINSVLCGQLFIKICRESNLFWEISSVYTILCYYLLWNLIPRTHRIQISVYLLLIIAFVCPYGSWPIHVCINIRLVIAKNQKEMLFVRNKEYSGNQLKEPSQYKYKEFQSTTNIFWVKS